MRGRGSGNNQELKHARAACGALFLILLGMVLSFVPANIHGKTYPGNVTITTMETWRLADSPHIVEGYLRIAPGVHLTLEPVVEVQIKSGQVFEVQDEGTLTAESTVQDPITITAISDQFIGLRLWKGGHTSRAYCDVSLAGSSGRPAVDIEATDVSLDHCVIRDSGAQGVKITHPIATAQPTSYLNRWILIPGGLL